MAILSFHIGYAIIAFRYYCGILLLVNSNSIVAMIRIAVVVVVVLKVIQIGHLFLITQLVVVMVRLVLMH